MDVRDKVEILEERVDKLEASLKLLCEAIQKAKKPPVKKKVKNATKTQTYRS